MADVTETTAAPEMIFGEVMDAHMAKEFAKIIHSEDSSSKAAQVADDQAAPPVEAAEAASDESKPNEPEAVEPEKPEPKETAKARNARLVEEARATENRELRERLAKLEGMIEASRKPQEVVPQAPVVDPDAPDPTKYPLGEIDARYLLDAARYTARKEIMSEREAQARTVQEATLAEAIKEANTKADALVGVGKAKYDDFEDVVVKGFQSGAWKMVPEIGDLILGSEHGADIVYALGSNPAEANRIASLPLAQQAAWFGRQEAMLEVKKPAAASPRGGSKAPEPLPIRARGFGGSTGDQPDTDAFRAFEARMRQQRQ